MPTKAPPEEAVYKSYDKPVPVILAKVIVVLDPLQIAAGALIEVIVGKELTVTVAVIAHPLLFLYVMTLVPVEIPVTNPELFTVATVGVAETQGAVAFAVAEPVNCVVDPAQTLKEPVIVGNALTITDIVLELENDLLL